MASKDRLYFNVREVLFDGPYTECGERCVGSLLFVIAEAQDGRRWGHPTEFKTEFECDEEGFPCVVGRAKAQADAELLLRKIEASPPTLAEIQKDNWAPLDPAYGSSAWSEMMGDDWDESDGWI